MDAEDQVIKIITEGDLESLKLLIKNGYDINTYIDKKNRTLIGLACLEDKLELVKFLIENGADISKNKNILFTICNCSRIEIFFYLLEKIPDIDLNIKWKGTDLIFYCEDVFIIKELIYRSANLYSVDGGGNIFFNYLKDYEQDEILDYIDEINVANIKPAKSK
jgi:ankyrin repeat protein